MNAPGIHNVEAEFFRMLNRFVEPRIREGFGSPRLVPGGLIVVETTGHKTGRRRRVPLVATRIQGHFLVSTFRGRHSQWVKNLAANPTARFWLRGRARHAKAFVLSPGRRPRPPRELPPLLRWVASALVPYTYAGWAFAVLTPEANPVRPRRPRPRGRSDSRRAR
jgi:deazaflavin-dependent oxidoreductase (nitroreductase family)